MGPRSALLLALVANAGCNAILGLDPVGDRDGATTDAVSDDDATADADLGPDADPCGDPTGTPDEDGDERRDACDNCPQYGQLDQADADGDGVGNLCDPHSNAPDHLVAFYGFSDPAFPPTLHFAQTPGPGTWSITGGQLQLRGAEAAHHYLVRVDVGLRDVTVDAQARLLGPLANPLPSSSRSVGVWADLEPTDIGPFPTGVVLETAESVSPTGGTTGFAHLVGVGVNGQIDTTTTNDDFFSVAQIYGFRLTCTESTARCDGFVTWPGMGWGLLIAPATTRAGGVGLRAFGVDVAFDYLVIYAPG